MQQINASVSRFTTKKRFVATSMVILLAIVVGFYLRDISDFGGGETPHIKFVPCMTAPLSSVEDVRRVTRGMTYEQVTTLLGAPHTEFSTESWYRDALPRWQQNGKNPFMDYGWYIDRSFHTVSVTFKSGRAYMIGWCDPRIGPCQSEKL